MVNKSYISYRDRGQSCSINTIMSNTMFMFIGSFCVINMLTRTEIVKGTCFSLEARSSFSSILIFRNPDFIKIKTP